MRIKTGWHRLIRCPKFEKKIEGKRTAKNSFCPSHVSQNLDRKNQTEREISSHFETEFRLQFGDKYR